VKQRAVNSAALCAALLCASQAHAAPGDGTRLEYARSDRAAHCPDQDALKSAVKKRLGYDPFFPAARQTIVVEITDADANGGLRARMRLVDEQGMIRGSRELSDKTENCGELVASLALAISIALDPSAALGEEPAVDAAAQTAPNQKKEAEPSAAEASEEPAGAATPVTPQSAAAPLPTHSAKTATVERRAASTNATKRDSEQSRFALRAAAFAALGAAPAPALGVRVGVATTWDWFRLVTEFADQFPASKSVAHVGGSRASLLSATLAPCVAHGPFAGCALFGVGSLHVEGLGILDANSERLLNVVLGARLEYAPTLIGHLRLLTHVDLVRSLTPITLRVHGQAVWETPAVSPALGLGLEWQF
jgi:hypothetical protein